MKNETTSKAVASIAGKVLKALEGWPDGAMVIVNGKNYVTVGQLKKLAGSALTQAKDKAKARK